uniref:Uncharacterized protein n=1 Tax=Cacopsylla melanoneura TaxID=428564 RepID=A0A8D8TYS4_9HEMI
MCPGGQRVTAVFTTKHNVEFHLKIKLFFNQHLTWNLRRNFLKRNRNLSQVSVVTNKGNENKDKSCLSVWGLWVLAMILHSFAPDCSCDLNLKCIFCKFSMISN